MLPLRPFPGRSMLTTRPLLLVLTPYHSLTGALLEPAVVVDPVASTGGHVECDQGCAIDWI